MSDEYTDDCYTETDTETEEEEESTDINEYSQNDSQDEDPENDFTQNERYKDIRKYGVKEETHNIAELKEYIRRQIITFFRSEAESWENLLNRNTFWNEGI